MFMHLVFSNECVVNRSRINFVEKSTPKPHKYSSSIIFNNLDVVGVWGFVELGKSIRYISGYGRRLLDHDLALQGCILHTLVCHCFEGNDKQSPFAHC